MPSTRETALLALFDFLKTVPGAEVLRNDVSINTIPAGSDGVINLFDGEQGEPDVSLSPLEYHFEHIANVSVSVQSIESEKRDQQMDDLLQKIGDVLNADVRLGGAVTDSELMPIVNEEVAIEGGEDIKTVVLPVILRYSTDSPVN